MHKVLLCITPSYSITEIVMCILTFVYVIITLLILRNNQRTIKHSQKQLEILTGNLNHTLKTSEIQSMNSIISSNREIMQFVFNTPEYLKLLKKSDKINFINTMFLNQQYIAYLQCKNNILGADDWEYFRNEIKTMFTLDSFQQQWLRTQDFFSLSFKQEMNSILESVTTADKYKK